MAADAPTASPSRALLLRLPGGAFLHERQIWRHRGLLNQMVRSDLRSRYVATSMGFFWSVIHPLLLLLVYIFVFTFIMARGFGDNLAVAHCGNFATYFCAGMLPWMWFSEALTGATSSIVAQGNLLRKNVFPAIILPMQPILSGLVHFLIGFGIYLAFRLAIFGWPGWRFLALPGVILLQFLLLVSLSYILAVVTVFWRDLSQILVSALMIWLWLTPIFYVPILFQQPITEHFGPHAYAVLLWLFRINPVFHLVSLYQQILFFTATPDWLPAPWISVLVLLVLIAVMWFLARRLFGRALPRIVEMV